MTTKFAACMTHLTKESEDKKEDTGRKYLQAAKHMGIGALGFGAGSAVGHGVGRLLERADSAPPVPGARIARWVGPAAGTGAGLAYSLWRTHENEKIRDALKDTNSGS